MKKFGVLLLCVLMLGLTACSLFPKYDDDEPYSAAFTYTEAAEPTEVFFDIPVQEKTTKVTYDNKLPSMKPEKSNSAKDLLVGSLFQNDGDVLSLWTDEIRYAFDGYFSDNDIVVAKYYAEKANKISGFPGMRETTVDQANVTISFDRGISYPQIQLSVGSGDQFTGAKILFPAGEDTIPSRYFGEMFAHLLGLQYKVDCELDSILAAPYNASDITSLDWSLVEFMYGHLKPGMNPVQCEKIFDDNYIPINNEG